MKKLFVLLAVALVSLGLFVVPAVARGSHTPTRSSGTFKDGPYTSTTQDSSTCGGNWAQDLFLRSFVVKLPAVGGSFTVTEKFSNGRFATVAGASPGACDTNPGGQITEGIVGSFKGTETIVVTPVAPGDFNPNGTCEYSAPGDLTVAQCLTGGWVHGFFGDAATYTVPAFNFAYKGPGSLAHNSWTNADTGNIGDIATS